MRTNLIFKHMKKAFLIFLTIQCTIFFVSQYYIYTGFDISNATNLYYCEDLHTSNQKHIHQNILSKNHNLLNPSFELNNLNEIKKLETLKQIKRKYYRNITGVKSCN